MHTVSYLLSKLGAVKAATRKKAAEIVTAAQNAGHPIRFVWGMGGGEHATGLALDVMVNDHDTGQWVRDYVWRNRKRLRLRHVIWERHITSTVVAPGRVRLMEDRGDPTQNHMDHVHMLFLAGGAYRPPGYHPFTPPAAVELSKGSTGQAVRHLQHGLRAVFPAYAGRLAVDGDFGPKTAAAVREFQKRAGIKSDGIVGPVTTRTLAQYGVRL